ncbi:hypothetical protein [Litorimonas haliclonae]|uniref:hypothetical protein n=1 Tax=Litorimonas haliclonae TaxID=2081977 RepID=UPI0039EF9067
MRSLFLTSALFFTATIAPTSFADEHPHKTPADKSEAAKAEKEGFSAKLKDRLSQYEKMEAEIETDNSEDKAFEKRVRVYKFKSGDKMREMSKDVEEMIVESGMLSNLADMLADFAEDIEIKKGEKIFSLRFDGDTLGEVNRDEADRVVLKSMDKEMIVEKETYLKDGETRTRIVIDMNGDGSDIDLDDVLTKE